MCFESVFIELNNFYINIYNINLSKKFMKIAFFSTSQVGRPLKARLRMNFSNYQNRPKRKIFEASIILQY